MNVIKLENTYLYNLTDLFSFLDLLIFTVANAVNTLRSGGNLLRCTLLDIFNNFYSY